MPNTLDMKIEYCSQKFTKFELNMIKHHRSLIKTNWKLLTPSHFHYVSNSNNNKILAVFVICVGGLCYGLYSHLQYGLVNTEA